MTVVYILEKSDPYHYGDEWPEGADEVWTVEAVSLDESKLEAAKEKASHGISPDYYSWRVTKKELL